VASPAPQDSADRVRIERLLAVLRQGRRREILGRLLAGLPDVLVLGLLGSLALGAAFDGRALGFSLLGLGLGLLAYLARLGLRDGSLARHAQRLDQALGLHDRISSAHAFARAERMTDFMRAHLAETAAFLERRGPLRAALPRPARLRAFGLFLVLGLVALVPHAERGALEARAGREASERRQREARSLTGELQRLARRAADQGRPRLARALARLEQELAAGRADPAPGPPPAGARADAAEELARALDEAVEPGLGSGETPAQRVGLARSLASLSERVGRLAGRAGGPEAAGSRLAAASAWLARLGGRLGARGEGAAGAAREGAERAASGSASGPDAGRAAAGPAPRLARAESVAAPRGGARAGGTGAGLGGSAGLRLEPAPPGLDGQALPLEPGGPAWLRRIESRGRRPLGAAPAEGERAEDWPAGLARVYARAAEAELEGERVPPELRAHVRAYFRAIRVAP
jgi:hypothetical protein